MNHTAFAWDSRNGRLYAGEGGELKNGMIPPKATITILARPQVPCQPIRWGVQASNAASFLIHDIKIGNNYQTAHGGAVILPDMFATKMDMLAMATAILESDKAITIKMDRRASEYFGGEFRLPIVVPGMDCYIMVENVSDKPERFIATYICEVHEGRFHQ